MPLLHRRLSAQTIAALGGLLLPAAAWAQIPTGAADAAGGASAMGPGSMAASAGLPSATVSPTSGPDSSPGSEKLGSRVKDKSDGMVESKLYPGKKIPAWLAKGKPDEKPADNAGSTKPD